MSFELRKAFDGEGESVVDIAYSTLQTTIVDLTLLMKCFKVAKRMSLVSAFLATDSTQERCHKCYWLMVGFRPLSIPIRVTLNFYEGNVHKWRLFRPCQLATQLFSCLEVALALHAHFKSCFKLFNFFHCLLAKHMQLRVLFKSGFTSHVCESLAVFFKLFWLWIKCNFLCCCWNYVNFFRVKQLQLSLKKLFPTFSIEIRAKLRIFYLWELTNELVYKLYSVDKHLKAVFQRLSLYICFVCRVLARASVSDISCRCPHMCKTPQMKLKVCEAIKTTMRNANLWMRTLGFCFSLESFPSLRPIILTIRHNY